MAFDDTILLKIKREFTSDEAVKELLRRISALEIEIGILKSERDEAIHKANRLLNKVETEGTKTKKSWLKDELVVLMDTQLKTQIKNTTEMRKEMEQWRNKYFSLLATTTNKKEQP